MRRGYANFRAWRRAVENAREKGSYVTTTAQVARQWATIVTALSVVAISGASLPSASVAAEPPAEWDGLVRVENRKLDHVYLLPGANFAGYKRIRLDPVQVAFDKNWDPNATERSPSRRLSDTDIEKIKSTLASEFRKVFSQELGEGGYKLVDEDGGDVLRVTAGIINLYITAPQKLTAGRSRTYVASSGHMSLVAELRDSVTSQLLARAVDNVQGRDTGSFQVASSVTNLGDARVALKAWARVLRQGLDDASSRSAK
jgi:Protein of unknown function (DUF3313)